MRPPRTRGDDARRVAARRCGLALAILVPAWAVCAPVEEYRDGPFCPRDRPASGGVIGEADAIERARTLLPDGFCGPGAFVDGCDFLTEYTFETWRVYAHQYRLRDGRHDWGALTHTYVILDRVGNCLANIPGTELGARR